MSCIFCSIVAGDIPSVKVFEDENALAIMDINPLSEGHVLVMPKQHAVNLFDIDDRLAGDVMAAAARVAKRLRAALNVEGMTLIQANGALSGQEVDHLHYHLVPRRPGDQVPFGWNPQPGDIETITSLGERIAAEMG